MNRFLFAAALAAGVAASGCAEKERSLPDVRIAPEIKSRVTGLHFDPEDCIGLTIVRGTENYVVNHPMTYDGSTFRSTGLLWYNDLNETSTLTAYYPYAPGGVSGGFSVATDQTGGWASSDLLGAVKRDVTPAGTPVGMLFHHLLSQLTIAVTNNSDAEVTGVTVEGFVPTADVDLTTPAAVAKAGVAAAPIRAFAVTPDESYRAVLVPQQGALTVRIDTRDGKSRTKTIPEATLAGGKRYDMSALVTNIDIELTLSGEISDWGEGGSLDDATQGGEGDKGDETGGDQTRLVYGEETYRTVRIGDRIWMAENLRNEPEGAVFDSNVWYPENRAAAAAELGLLYNHALATGGPSTRAGGYVQGICPAGWHIPSAAELEALAASADRAADFFSCAGYWNSGKTRFEDATKGYLMSCETVGSDTCTALKCLADGAPELVSTSVDNGISVRCVRDAAVR